MPNIPQGLRAAAAAALLIVPLTGCGLLPEGNGKELQKARAEEEVAEEILEDALSLPDSDPGKTQLVSEARENESEKERIRRRLEASTRGGLLEQGLDVVTDAASGDYIGAGEGILAALGGLALVWLRRKTRKELDEDNERLRRETDAKLAEVERKRDETRRAQGLAPASVRSVEAAKSPAALAATQAQEAAIQRQVDALLAQRLAQFTPQGAPQPTGGHTATAPVPPAQRSSGPEQWSAGVGVPAWENNPGPVPGGEA